MNTKCQIFTPQNYVKKMLNSVGYCYGLFGKKIMENSCGEGNVLKEIVTRYIKDCINYEMTADDIKKGLSADIYGVEIDSNKFNKCIHNLNEIAASFGIKKVKWSIFNEDYLEFNNGMKYDYIVGNPPYISYNEIDDREKKFLKKNFDTCQKGKFDYCYAFIEKSISDLFPNGKMAYLIPSSIFKTNSGIDLRKMIAPYLIKILDYSEMQIFQNASVKSSIIVLTFNSLSKKCTYINEISNSCIDFSPLANEKKWHFGVYKESGKNRFGDYFKVVNSVATLYNKAFLLENISHVNIKKDYIIFDGYKIERKLVKTAASPKSIKNNKKEYIIFPYYYKNGSLQRYSEREFVSSFPYCTKYLKTNNAYLYLRDAEKNTSWFEYGRSQGLSLIHQDKLLISSVVTSKLSVFELKKDCIPYAGLFITIKENNFAYSLKDAIGILEDDKFIKYVNDIGVHINGSSLRITSKDIENYKF